MQTKIYSFVPKVYIILSSDDYQVYHRNNTPKTTPQHFTVIPKADDNYIPSTYGGLGFLVLWSLWLGIMIKYLEQIMKWF